MLINIFDDELGRIRTGESNVVQLCHDQRSKGTQCFEAAPLYFGPAPGVLCSTLLNFGLLVPGSRKLL